MRLQRGLTETQLHLLLTCMIVQGLEECTSASAADVNHASSKDLAAKAGKPQEPPKPSDFPSLSRSTGGGTAAAAAPKEAAAAKETARQNAAASTASKTMKKTLVPGEAATEEKVAMDNGKGIKKQPAKQRTAQAKQPPQLSTSAAEISQAAGNWEEGALTQAVEPGWGASVNGHGNGWPAGTTAQQSQALDPQPQVMLTHSCYLERTLGKECAQGRTKRISTENDVCL